MDCSQTLAFSHELKRMCDGFIDNSGSCTDECPFRQGTISCPDLFEIKQDQIDAVQKWSDEHPPETFQSKFFGLFPNADKDTDGSPALCRARIFGSDCPSHKIKPTKEECQRCWNEPIPEEEGTS